MDENKTEQKIAPLSIAIKMPEPLHERILAFPFIHLLSEAYPTAELHFISPKYHLEVLYTLPFKGYYHDWDLNEIPTVLDVHRYVANMKIGKVDIFISLGTSWRELSLGKFLRAPKRIGFAEGAKAWMMTLPVRLPQGLHVSEKFFGLYKELTNNSYPHELTVLGKELPAFYPQLDAYIAVDIGPFNSGSIDSFWADWFAMQEGKTFVIFSSEEPDKGSLLLPDYLSKLPEKNKYIHFSHSNWIELGKMLAHAKGLVARNGAVVAFAAYLGCPVLAIYESGDPRRDAPFHFDSRWNVLDLSDPSLRLQEKEGMIKPRPSPRPEVLFSKTLETFRF